MFTGIIEGLGTIKQLRSSTGGTRLTVEAGFDLSRTKVGDSIAVSGACLTAVSLDRNRFDADVSPETMARTAFIDMKIGDRVNLERALRLSDGVDGHLVSGHIDGTGTIRKITNVGNAIIVLISVPEFLLRYMIKKGSVAIDGISLTINNLTQDDFEVSVIPHTAGITSIGFRKTGELVNIETDMIGKYVERFVTGKRAADNDEKGKSDMDLGFLDRTGFL